MWIYENLGLIIGGVFIAGLSGHFASRRRHRRSYVALRDAYEEAVREVRESGGDAAALVRGQELHREFVRAYYPGWFEGFGRRLRTVAKVCAALTLLAFFLKGPIEHGEEEYAKRLARAAPGGLSSKTTGFRVVSRPDGADRTSSKEGLRSAS